MRRCVGVAVILLLGLGILPATLSAQQPGGSTSGDRGAHKSGLLPNYPNPFNPSTTVRFEVVQEDVGSAGAKVTIRILNVLQQLVAYPEAKDGSGRAVNNLVYDAPGVYEAYWDGMDRNHNQVASGLYYIQLVINGRTAYVRKALVTK